MLGETYEQSRSHTKQTAFSTLLLAEDGLANRSIHTEISLVFDLRSQGLFINLSPECHPSPHHLGGTLNLTNRSLERRSRTSPEKGDLGKSLWWGAEAVKRRERNECSTESTRKHLAENLNAHAETCGPHQPLAKLEAEGEGECPGHIDQRSVVTAQYSG